MIRNIVFDFGGVLVDWNPRYLYEKLSQDSEKITYFLNQVCTPEWNLELDAGRSFSEAIREHCREFPEFSDWIEAYQTRWPEMLRSEIRGSVEILETLHQRGFPLYGLTNWSHETFPCALERFPFFQLFRGIVVSGQEKRIKPDPEIFQCLIRRYSLRPEESLFIDDVPKNTEAARRLGFRTHIFSSPDRLREFLTDELGIL